MSGAAGLLDQRVDSFEVADPTVTACADRLRALGVRVCSFATLPASASGPLVVPPASLHRLLDAIVGANPGYRWDEPKPGLLNLYPDQSVLDEAVAPLTARSKGAWRVLEEDVGIGTFGITLFQELGDPDGPEIDLELRGTDLRGALNEVVARLRPLVWHIAGRPGQLHLSFTNVTR